eukprot:403373289
MKKNLTPQRIVKYENEVKHNADTKKKDYLINVSFLDKDNQKHLYEWCKKQDAIEAAIRIDDPKMLQSSEGRGKQQQIQSNEPAWQTSQYSAGAQQQQPTSQSSVSGQQTSNLSKDLGSKEGQSNIKKEQFQQNLPQQMQL